MELIVKGSYLFYYLWVRGVTRPPPAGLEKDRVNFHYDHISTDRFARHLTMDDYTYLRLLCSIGYKPWQTHQRHYLIEQFSELLFQDIIQVYELPERYRNIKNRYNFGLSFHEGYEKFEAEEKAKQSTGGQNISGTTAASSAPQEDELLPAIGPGNRPATLGPHDGQPLDGLHNQQTDKQDSNSIAKKTEKSSQMEVELAKSNGNRPEQIKARKKVAKNYLKNNGFTEAQLTDALGSDDGTRVGGIDLSKSVEVVKFPPPDKMFQYVKSHGYPGNWFDPKGNQTADSLGISDEGRKLATFKVPAGDGLLSYSKPILDDWTNNANPVETDGGGRQLLINDKIKKEIISINQVGK